MYTPKKTSIPPSDNRIANFGNLINGAMSTASIASRSSLCYWVYLNAKPTTPPIANPNMP